ncbi:MAG: HU family DNA-binding protein [Oscillospiraceae bacterium]|nr:HU family DNA-binding protein [Oscillospiraceae bacterium]MBR2895536.1 HU family DNA-binding protein [Oscillospiraceae bacterium]
MNKNELISEVAERSNLTKKDVETAISTMVEVISDALCDGDKVQLVGFGSFEVKKRNARVGRNPKTKEMIEIPATKVPVFKAGKLLKDSVAR